MLEMTESSHSNSDGNQRYPKRLTYWIISFNSASVRFCPREPRERMTVPSSFVVIVPVEKQQGGGESRRHSLRCHCTMSTS
jgi:hypothetical protein